MPICLRLFVQRIRDAASRTFWTAGRSRPIRMAMMAITTSNSMSVNARREARDPSLMAQPSGQQEMAERQPFRLEPWQCEQAIIYRGPEPTLRETRPGAANYLDWLR